MDLQELNDGAISAAKRLGADDAVSICSDSGDSMIRFANNSVTVVNRVEEAELSVYLAKDGKRAIASTSNLEPASVKRFVSDLYRTLKGLPKSEYVPLPKKAARYSPTRVSYDRRLEDMDDRLPGLAKAAIESSLSAGGQRSAGVIAQG